MKQVALHLAERMAMGFGAGVAMMVTLWGMVL